MDDGGRDRMIYSPKRTTRFRTPPLPVLASLQLLGGCATRPVNPPITQADPSTGYRLEVRQARVENKDNLVVLAFSGGGTRAAAFSYGVLEFLRRTEIVGPKGNRGRLLDWVDVITGVSGGSFTALAYGLYGDKRFTGAIVSSYNGSEKSGQVMRAMDPTGDCCRRSRPDT
jgi:predicted acylesterase/phospholipase RssA